MGYRKTYWEYGTNAKSSATSVYSAELNAGNIAAQEALRADFEAAIDAVSLGNSGSEQFVANEEHVTRNPSLNPLAHRGNKWLVVLSEANTGNPFSFTIPCADVSLLGQDGDSMDTNSPEYAALVTATEAFARSNDGNLGTVVSVTFRTRTI